MQKKKKEEEEKKRVTEKIIGGKANVFQRKNYLRQLIPFKHKCYGVRLVISQNKFLILLNGFIILKGT